MTHALDEAAMLVGSDRRHVGTARAASWTSSKTGWLCERDSTIVSEAAVRRDHRAAMDTISAANRQKSLRSRRDVGGVRSER